MDSTDSFNDKHELVISNMYDLCIRYRGMVVHFAVDIETEMERCVSYFLSNNSERTTDIIMLLGHQNNLMSFANKLLIITYIVNTYYPEFKNKHSTMLSDIDFVMQKRNIVAHRKMLITEENILNFDGKSIKIEWTKTKNGKMTTGELNLNPAFIEELGSKASRCANSLEKLRELIKKGENGL